MKYFRLLLLTVSGLTVLGWAAPQAEAFWWWGAKKSAGSAVSKKSPAQDAASQAVAPDALNVLKAYQMALKQSESVAISEKEIDLARSRFYRSFNYILPKVHFEMTHFEQDVSTSSDASSGFNFGRRTIPMNRFTFSQPIFSGFREIAALRASGSDRRQYEARWRRAKELLFVDVMEAYFNVLSERRDLETLEKQKGFLAERVKDLDQRVGLGRSRQGEMKTAVADEKMVEADLVVARSAVARSENLLAFYIGRPVSDFNLKDTEPVSGDRPLGEALQMASKRSDVMAEVEARTVAEQKVVSAQANLFPTVSLDGNYYTRRPGFQDGNDWDVTLKLDVPVFEVATTLADIKEAHAKKEQQRLLAQEALRRAELEIRDAHEDWVAAQAAKTALEAAADAAQENASLETADFGLNLVNSLDVLDALRRSLDVRRRANDAFFEARKSWWRYQIAMGELPS